MRYLKLFEELTPEQERRHKEIGKELMKVISDPWYRRYSTFTSPLEVSAAVDRLKYILEDEGFKIDQ